MVNATVMMLRTRQTTGVRRFQVHQALPRLFSSSALRSQSPAAPSFLPSAFSVLTLAHDTKHDIVQLLRKRVFGENTYPNRRLPASEHPFGQLQVPAAVVLASPRHASWLNDVHFMAEVVRELKRMSQTEQYILTKFHLLAAVVEGLPAITPGGVPQEGLSFLMGHADRLLPGLWSDTHQSLPDTVASSLSFATTVTNTHAPKFWPRARYVDIGVTLPLANTLFLTGRRTTLLVSEWDIVSDDAKIERSRTAEKRNQTVNFLQGRLSVECRLHAITPPRIVADVLGNIVSKIEIEGTPSPASADLQREIPIWLQDRNKQSPKERTPGPVAVWALVTPRQYILDMTNSNGLQQRNQFQESNRFQKRNEFQASKESQESSEQVLSKHKALFEGASVGALVRRCSRLVRVCKYTQPSTWQQEIVHRL